MNKIQEGIGDKIANFFQWFSSFLAGFIIGFIYGWKLTLVIMAVSPLLVACGVIFMKVRLIVCANVRLSPKVFSSGQLVAVIYRK